MPYGVVYRFDFVSFNGAPRRVELLREGYRGPVRQMPYPPGTDPLSVTEGVRSGSDEKTVQGTKIALQLLTAPNFGIKTFVSDLPRQWRVDVYEAGALDCTGYLAEDLPAQSIVRPDYFTLEATDGLADLDAEPFTDAAGKGIEGLVTPLDAFRYCLAKTGLALPLEVADELYPDGGNAAQCGLAQVKFDALQFSSDDGTPDKAGEVLEKLCLNFGLTVRQRRGVWLLESPRTLGTVRPVFCYDEAGRFVTTRTEADVRRVEAADERPAVPSKEKALFLFGRQTVQYNRATKSVALKLDYRRLVNRLRNSWFSSLLPPRPDGVRMPAFWGTTPYTNWQLETPGLNAENYFGRRYLRLNGRRKTDKYLKSGLLSYAVGASASDAFENCFFQVVAVPNVQNVRISGRFQQTNAQGVKVAVFACPFRTTEAYREFHANPARMPAERDLRLAYTYTLQTGMNWAEGDDNHLFDNTETRLVNGVETEFANPNWKGFDLSFRLGPFWNFGGLAGRDDQKIKNGGIPLFAKSGQNTLFDVQVPVPGYLLMIALGEAVDFFEDNDLDEEKTPASSAFARYDSLTLTYSPVGEADTKAETHVAEAPKGSGGKVEDEKTVYLGDARNPNYYATLFMPDGLTPTRLWVRRGWEGDRRPLLHHVAAAALSMRRVPMLTVSGEVLSGQMRAGQVYELGWPDFDGMRFAVAGADSSGRYDTHRAVLVQVPDCGDSLHTYTRRDVLSDRTVVVEQRQAGSCDPARSFGDLRILAVLQNGIVRRKPTGGGSILQQIAAMVKTALRAPYGKMTAYWFDREAAPPYRVIVKPLIGGDALVDRTLPGTETYFELPSGLTYELTVENANGSRDRRVLTPHAADLEITEDSALCASTILQGSLRLVHRPAPAVEYHFRLWNLLSGKTRESSRGIRPLDGSFPTEKILTWASSQAFPPDRYVVEVEDAATGQKAQIVRTLAGCKPLVQEFAGRYETRFK